MTDVADPALDGEISPVETDPSEPSAATGWLAGTIGAALALSVGELADNLSESITSLVVGIGEVVIDLTPGQAVATSINNIGSLQKPLLLVGIVVVALLIGGWLGRRGVKQRAIIPVGFAAFGIVGAISTARDNLTSGIGSWLVALLAAAIGAATTLLLLAIAQRQETTRVITPGAPLSQAANRRHFLAFGGAAIGTAAVYGASRVGRQSAAERAREQILTDGALTDGALTAGDSAATDAVASPAGSFVPTAGEFDGINGITPYITPISPSDDFYLIDTALTKPQVNPADWALTIGGFVSNPLSLTYDDLRSRDMVEREVTLSCVSNPVGGSLVGNAHWRGILLRDLLDEAGVVDPTDMATQVFSRSVDGWTCGFPTPLAYDGRTAMLALEMNGEPLPIKHGFPARLVVAGLYGYVSATKWIDDITITDWDGVDGYWMSRGWSKVGPIKTQSRIDVPRNNASVAVGPVALGGIAWSPTVGIDRVEVSVDEGPWQVTQLATVDSEETWVQWKLDWDAPVGDHQVQVRATDKSGFTQSPIPVNPAPNGAEGYDRIKVRVT